jgi:predicted AAA+ superfamily ATPase
MLYIDEAQRVSDIGINLKILHDTYPDLKILVTGSSSFDLANGIREPLTGRISTYILYPISLCELADRYNSFELSAQYRDQMMVYGAYPDILLEKNMLQKRKLLTELATSYIYKDILLLEHIRYPEKLHKLLKLLAYQI